MKGNGVINCCFVFFIFLVLRNVKSSDEHFASNNQPEGKIEIALENELGNIRNYNISMHDIECELENCLKCQNVKEIENDKNGDYFKNNYDNKNRNNIENMECVKCQDEFVLYEGKCYGMLLIKMYFLNNFYLSR